MFDMMIMMLTIACKQYRHVTIAYAATCSVTRKGDVSSYLHNRVYDMKCMNEDDG